MNTVARFVSGHKPTAWLAVWAASLTVAALLGWISHRWDVDQRLSLLQTETQRSSLEITSTTLNGNLMGSITLLGLIDRDIKQEATNGLLSADAHIYVTLSTVGNAFNAEGLFVVGEDGIVKTSWDRVGKPSTGLNVQFRPYYKMATQGKSSVYAAVSMARGDRSLYFTAPVFAEQAISTSGSGAVVARTNLDRVDRLLKGRPGIESLLLSPQGIVFASSKPDWVGDIDGAPDGARLAEIRALKQFGPFFETKTPQVLPLRAIDGLQRVDTRPVAVASAAVRWNDPSGDWRLVLIEDLGLSVDPWPHIARGSLGGVITLLIGWLCLHLLSGHHAQQQSGAQLQVYATQQSDNLAYRAKVSAVALGLQRCQSVQELATAFLRDVRELLGAMQGVLYVANPQTDVLELAGAAACDGVAAPTLTLGEGLLGQAALDRRAQTIATPPHGIWTVRSGLGTTSARALLLAPLVVQDQLIGALEIAMPSMPDAACQERFEDLAVLLANNLEILRRHAPPLVQPPTVRPAEEFPI